MPPPNFVSITVSHELRERIHRARALLTENGFASLPDGAVPEDRSNIGATTALEVALGLFEMHFAKRGKR